MAAANALALGVSRNSSSSRETAPDALDGLEPPDAVFIGGGLSEASFAAAWQALRPLGRMVCNAVTAEDEAILPDLHKRYGGQLVRLMSDRADGQGKWQRLDPVMQLSMVKR